MMGCHVVTWDEITKLQEFITLSHWSLQSIYGHFKIFLNILKYIGTFLKDRCLRQELKNFYMCLFRVDFTPSHGNRLKMLKINFCGHYM